MTDERDELPEIMQYFEYEHTTGDVRMVSRPFELLAYIVVGLVPDCTERAVALQKLLESKDAAVAAVLLKERREQP